MADPAISQRPIVSVMLAAFNEAGNIGPLIEQIKVELNKLGLTHEVIVVDGGSKDATRAEAEAAGARTFVQQRPGYGGAICEGFSAVRGSYVLTMDADGSHSPALIPELWKTIENADIVIASRFVKGGGSEVPLARQHLSIILNTVFGQLLAVPIKDLSSGYRLYKRKVLRPERYTYENFNVLQEIIIRAFADGFHVREVPLHMLPRQYGASHVAFVKFALSYLPTLYHLWILRHSPEAADYESHAYFSRHLLQRSWQRKRTALLKSMLKSSSATLDIGCGSSMLTKSLENVTALDMRAEKLRYLSRSPLSLVQARAEDLPFCSASFPQAVLSEVLPSVTDPARVIREAARVVEKGGKLLITFPDEATIGWKILSPIYYRLLPNMRINRPPTRLSMRDLRALLAESGLQILKTMHIYGAEAVVLAQKN